MFTCRGRERKEEKKRGVIKETHEKEEKSIGNDAGPKGLTRKRSATRRSRKEKKGKGGKKRAKGREGENKKGKGIQVARKLNKS